MIAETIRQCRIHIIEQDELLEGDVWRPLNQNSKWLLVTSVSSYSPRRTCSREAKPEEIKL